MNIYSDKLAHLQVVINCLYSVAQMCTCEDTLAYILGTPSIDDVITTAGHETRFSLPTKAPYSKN